MKESNQQHPDEKRLWQQFSVQEQIQPVLSDLDPNLLAAYLDGQADAAQVQQIESVIASNPVLLDELIELRSVQDAGPALVPESLLDRAQALLAPQQTIRRTSLWQRLQWTAAAAAVLLACVGGYAIGQTTFEAQRTVEASVRSQATLELGGVGLAVILQPNGSNGGEE
jgi:anti-sigma factor RsiW